MVGFPTAAVGCRVRTFDLLGALADPRGREDVTVVFVGEIVAVRSLSRLEELRRCRPRVVTPRNPETDEPALDCMETDPEISLEVYPIEVLRGQPQYPAMTRPLGCASLSPRVGSRALVVQTSGGSLALVLRADEPDYPHSIDDEYLHRVRRCVAGECPGPFAE